MNKIWHALCPIRQYDNKLELYCNSYKHGHTHLIWYNVEDPENKKEGDITSPFIVLTGLEQGEYVFYTRDEEVSSIKMYIQILKETTEEAVIRIEQYVDNINQLHQDALRLLRASLKSEPTIRPASHLIALYRALQPQNTDMLKAYFELITIAQFCENIRSTRMNKDNEAMVCINNKSQMSIEVSSMVSRVIIHKIIGGQKVHCLTIATDEEKIHMPQLADNSEYIIEAYAENNLVGVYVHFSGDNISKQWLWATQCAINNKIADAKEQLLDLPVNFVKFTAEEQERILIEQSKTPFDQLVGRPEALVNKNNVTISIEDSAFLMALGNFYVVAKEPDQLFVNGFDRVELIKGPEVSFNKAKHLLSNAEDYYFYIQDANKRVVSGLELISLVKDIDYSDYKENLRQLELYNYTKRLLPLINYRTPAASEIIKDLLDTANTIPEINAVNAYKYLINGLNTNKHFMYFNGAINAIMEDKVSNSLFTQQFFPNGIKSDRALDKLVFPPKSSQYILQVDKISINNSEIITEYYESGLGAIEVQYREADYFIYQAIDKQTYRRSGYVFVNTSKYNSCISNWNIDIEVI